MAAPVPRFDQRIENLSGVIHSDEDAVKQWLVDGCYDVIRKMKQLSPEGIHQFISVSSELEAAANVNLDEIKEIISVERGTYDCRKVPFLFKREVSDTGSIYYATATDPVYYIHNGNLSIKPDPESGAGNSAYYYYLPDYLVQSYSSGTSTIDDFPSDFYEHICTYAAMQVLYRLLVDKRDSLPSDIGDIALDIISEILPTYSIPATLTIPPPPPGVNVNVGDVGTIDSYTVPVFTAPVLAVIGEMDLPNPPVAPNMNEKSVSITGTAPTYTAVVYTPEDSPIISNLAIATIAPVTPNNVAIGVLPTSTVPTYLAPTMSVTTTPNLAVTLTPPLGPLGALNSINFTSSPPVYIQAPFTATTVPVLSDLAVLSVADIGFTENILQEIDASSALFDFNFESLPAYLKPVMVFEDLTIAATAPTVPVNFENAVTITGTAPTFSAPSTVVSASPVIADLDISTIVVPTAPLVIANLFDMPAIPVYTAPVVSLPDQLDLTIVPPLPPSLQTITLDESGLNVPTFTPPVMGHLDFTDTNNWITDEEDNEMLSSRITEINAKISEYSTLMDESKQKYEVEKQIFDKELEIEKMKSDILNAFDDKALKKYQSDIQTFNSNIDNTIKEFQANNTQKLQKYQTDVTSAANDFKEESTIFQAAISANIKEAELKDAGQVRDLQKFNTEMQRYQAEVQSQIGLFQQNYQKEFQLWNTSNTLAIQKYQTDIQNETQSFNKLNVEYQALLQKDVQNAQLQESKSGRDLQKYSNELQQYQVDINKEIQIWSQNNGMNLQKYDGDMKNSLNVFNHGVVQYQTNFQRVVKNLDEYDKKVERFLGHLQVKTNKYQMDVNKEVQQYQQSVQKDLQVFSQESQAGLQEYQLNMTNNLNSFNQQNIEYQADLQVAIQNAQLEESKDGRDLQKYSTELNGYQQDINKEIQVFQQNAQALHANNQSKLQKYQADTQNALHIFNKENVEYQALLQTSFKNADFDDIKLNRDVQLYSAALQQYQVDVNTEVQVYQQNSQRDLQIWSQENQFKFQEYQANAQNALNTFNKEQVEYQALLQKDLQDAGLKESKEGRDLQKYSTELNSYQAQVNKEVQRWTNEELGKKFQEWSQLYTGQLQEYQADMQNESAKVSASANNFQVQLQKAIQIYQSETGYDLSKYQTEVQAEINKYQALLADAGQTFGVALQKYQSDLQTISSSNQSKLAKFSVDLQNHQAKISTLSVDYQWAQGQLAYLKQHYNELFGISAQPERGR